jgi:hypothetical protein
MKLGRKIIVADARSERTPITICDAVKEHTDQSMPDNRTLSNYETVP